MTAFEDLSQLRAFMSIVEATVAGAAVFLAASAPAEPLHILIVHTDEHRIDCLGAYGNKEERRWKMEERRRGGMGPRTTRPRDDWA